jgi:hypothetical protein
MTELWSMGEGDANIFWDIPDKFSPSSSCCYISGCRPEWFDYNMEELPGSCIGFSTVKK